METMRETRRIANKLSSVKTLGEEEEERREMEKVRQRRERKVMRDHQKMVLDEMLPKATGREARIEKKRARAEERRAREISPGESRLLLVLIYHFSLLQFSFIVCLFVWQVKL